MTSQEVNELTKGLERRLSYEKEHPYSNIANWFPPQLLNNIKAIEDGASGVRPIGRLAFFHNYRKIKQAIETAENRTRGHEQKLLENQLRVEPGLTLFVCGSLCGGTGSGMFLDMAYSLRNLYQDQDTKIIGYFIISPELYGDTPSMNAGTYAALKELNYYTSKNNCFMAEYDHQHQIEVNEKRPPYDFTYLVTNRTKNGHKILEKGKLCNIIAHKIYLDFADELSRPIESNRNNYTEDLAKNDEHPRPNSQCYLTFGLAKIYFPRDLTVQVALNKIKLKLLHFWRNGEGQSPDVIEILNRFILKWGSDSEKQLIQKLEDTTLQNNKTFSQSLKAWRNKLERKVLACKIAEDRQRFIQQLPGDLRSQFRQVQPGNTERERGIWLTNFQNSSVKLNQTLQQNIISFLGEILNPSNADFSLNTAQSFLEALTTTLNGYQRNLEETIQELPALYTLDNIEQTYQDVHPTFQEIEQKKSFLRFKDQRNPLFQETAQGLIQSVTKKIKHNGRITQYQEVLKIVIDLQEFLQNYSKRSSDFDYLLREVILNYEKREDSLKGVQENEMNGEAIFIDEDTDSCYQSLLPDSNRRSQLTLLSTKITESIRLDDSLVSFLIQDKLIENTAIQEKFDEVIESLFGSQSLNIVEYVIKRFLQKYPYSDGEIRLKQILREAEPLIPLNLDGYYYDNPRKSFQIIGFNETDEREVNKFKALLKQNLGISDDKLVPIQTEDEVIFINEYAAFPLRLINGLSKMRSQYNRQQKYEAASLHTDYRKGFIDIIPPDARKMEDLQDIFYTCLALGILSENQNTNCYDFQYYDELRNEYYVAKLSYVWNEALDLLATSQEMTNTLRQMRDQAFHEIEYNPSLWETQYLPAFRGFINKVDNLPEYDPNYPEKITVAGEDPGSYVDENSRSNGKKKEGIVFRIMRYIYKEILKDDQPTPPPKLPLGPNDEQPTLPPKLPPGPNDSDDRKNREKKNKDIPYTSEKPLSFGDEIVKITNLLEKKWITKEQSDRLIDIFNRNPHISLSDEIEKIANPFKKRLIDEDQFKNLVDAMIIRHEND